MAAKPIRYSAWVPQSVVAWHRATCTNVCEQHVLLGDILSDLNVHAHAQHVLDAIQKFEDSDDRLKEFLFSVSQLPEQVKAQKFRSPATVKQILSQSAKTARKLASQLSSDPDLFDVHGDVGYLKNKLEGHDIPIRAQGDFDLGALLCAFAAESELRTQQTQGVDDFPVGRKDGGSAQENYVIEQISTLAVVHLGKTFPDFTAEIASVVLDVAIGEARVRSRTPGLSGMTLE